MNWVINCWYVIWNKCIINRYQYISISDNIKSRLRRDTYLVDTLIRGENNPITWAATSKNPTNQGHYCPPDSISSQKQSLWLFIGGKFNAYVGIPLIRHHNEIYQKRSKRDVSILNTPQRMYVIVIWWEWLYLIAHCISHQLRGRMNVQIPW